MKSYLFFFVALLVSCGSGDQTHTDFVDHAAQENHEEQSKYPDDTYCATVGYSNPSTGTESSYTVTVVVEDNEVTQLNWPNGGTLDHDHFEAAELDEDGHAEFTSDKGYDYTVEITGESAGCLENAVQVKQCIGVTKKGTRCRHVTDNSNQLCWQHQNQAKGGN